MLEYQQKYGRTQAVKWPDITPTFDDRWKVVCNEDTLRNRWNHLRNKYREWMDLRHGETGLGWDYSKGTILADDDWWDKKIKVPIRQPCLDIYLLAIDIECIDIVPFVVGRLTLRRTMHNSERKEYRLRWRSFWQPLSAGRLRRDPAVLHPGGRVQFSHEWSISSPTTVRAVHLKMMPPST